MSGSPDLDVGERGRVGGSYISFTFYGSGDVLFDESSIFFTSFGAGRRWNDQAKVSSMIMMVGRWVAFGISIAGKWVMC